MLMPFYMLLRIRRSGSISQCRNYRYFTLSDPQTLHKLTLDRQ